LGLIPEEQIEAYVDALAFDPEVCIHTSPADCLDSLDVQYMMKLSQVRTRKHVNRAKACWRMR
jgi:hypothetical protein